MPSPDKDTIDSGFVSLLRKTLLKQTIVEPEILLDIDYFNSILVIDDQPIQLPSGFYVTSTFFGHVISGSHSTHHEQFSGWRNHSLTVDVEDFYRHYEMFQFNENEFVNAPTQQQEAE
ncbi:unnamed protein product [Cylicocyclus nassatus]|uniref:Uncharacterized protein n=1 Tax=Cylicocyclus nassatus TaxID=53992 RepID=A0AA36GHK7_CYLNA|nr:unnamed protein product [Cylicocyclus nassatus]